jgi:hypothetical protein
MGILKNNLITAEPEKVPITILVLIPILIPMRTKHTLPPGLPLFEFAMFPSI